MHSSGGVVLSEKLILGLDVGTSSVKAIFINEYGDVLERVEVKIATISAEPGLAEQRAEDYLDALRSIAEFNKDLTRNLIAIGVSGHTPSVVCIDENGSALRPVLTWQDTRAQKESQELQEVFGNPLEVIGTSLPWSPSACPAKLLWLSRNESWLVQKVRWVLQPKDYVGFHLTGEAISDPWSSKGLCNVITRKPIESLLKYTGWSTSIVPELRDGYSSRGNVSQAAASAFGFPSGIPVSTGWSDAMSGMVAIDVMREPTSFIITGTSAIVGSSTHTPPKDGGSLYLIPETCAPLTITYGPTQSSGSSIAWACDLLEINLDEVMNFSQQSEGKNLPIYLPYIYGERAPLWRADIQGGFYGVTGNMRKAEFAAAVLEGISFAEKQVLEAAEGLNGETHTTVKLGGHAGNDARWERIRLQTLGRNIARYDDVDTTTRGAAILAHAVLSGNLAESSLKLRFKPLESSANQDNREYSQRKFQEFLLAQSFAIRLADHKKEQI